MGCPAATSWLTHPCFDCSRVPAQVDAAEALQAAEVIRHAVWRYEHCWVPLLKAWASAPKRRRPLVAPLDVAWVWLVHLLHPVSYALVSIPPAAVQHVLAAGSSTGPPALQTCWRQAAALACAPLRGPS